MSVDFQTINCPNCGKMMWIETETPAHTSGIKMPSGEIWCEPCAVIRLTNMEVINERKLYALRR